MDVLLIGQEIVPGIIPSSKFRMAGYEARTVGAKGGPCHRLPYDVEEPEYTCFEALLGRGSRV
jgi:hypothetical protein